MDIDEIYRLSKWVREEIGAKKITKSFQVIVSKLRTMTQPNQPKVAFEQDKAELVNLLNGVPLYQLTHEQKKFLDKFDMLSFMGEAGPKYIDDIFHDNTHDIVTVANKLEEAQSKVSNCVAKFAEIENGLKIFTSGEISPEGDKALIRVTFTKDAAITNIVEMEEWSENWKHIIRGFTLVFGNRPEDIKIAGVSNGSLLLDLLANLKVAGALTSTLVGLATLAEKILKLKDRAKEMRESDFEGKDEIAEKIEDSVEKEKEKAVNSVVVNIQNLTINNYGDNPQARMPGDNQAALTTAAQKLIDFLERGGEIDIIPPEEKKAEDQPDTQAEIRRLRAEVENLRKIEYKRQLLVFRDTNDE